MATKYATIKGWAEWAKVYDPDSFSGAENWKLNFYPFDQEEWDRFNATGVELKHKKNESAHPLFSNKEFITFRRPTKKAIKDELVIFAPPEISGKIVVRYVDETGEKIRQYNKGDKKKIIRVDAEGEEIEGPIDDKSNSKLVIWNGSIVLVNFSYYDTAKGKGHRLENIKVLEIAEYEAPDEPKDEPKETPKKEPKKEMKKELNDDIPW